MMPQHMDKLLPCLQLSRHEHERLGSSFRRAPLFKTQRTSLPFCRPFCMQPATYLPVPMLALRFSGAHTLLVRLRSTNTGKSPQLAGYYAYWERAIFNALNAMVSHAMSSLQTMIDSRSKRAQGLAYRVRCGPLLVSLWTPQCPFAGTMCTCEHFAALEFFVLVCGLHKKGDDAQLYVPCLHAPTYVSKAKAAGEDPLHAHCGWCRSASNLPPAIQSCLTNVFNNQDGQGQGIRGGPLACPPAQAPPPV
eukprot:scaffold68798_cov19-Tisochrysis_lutea.AAC.1